MGKSHNRYKKERGLGQYNQSIWMNQEAVAAYSNMLLALAMNRFRWVGLPETCDARFLELQLHTKGLATLCHDVKLPDVWQTLMCAPIGDYNVYGYPVKWRARGYGNTTEYDVTYDNGELIYYSQSRSNPWIVIDMYAKKLAHYTRIEDVNLMHQARPVIYIAAQEKKLELVNLLKQVNEFEPAILGDDNFGSIVDSIRTIDTQVPLLSEELGKGYQNALNQYLLAMGIPHLAFEKGERMIEDEARANTAPTNIMLLDCLNARRDLCRKAKRFGLELEVYYNTDWESYNFNYLNNVEAMAQDGMMNNDTVE